MRDFAEDNPHVARDACCGSRTCSATTWTTPFAHALRLPVVPEIFGFDPRLQFTHEDDVAGALVYATTHDVPGIYNVAGDGTIAVERGVHDRRQAARARFRRCSPAWRPSRCGRCACSTCRPRCSALLRYGRGVDNSRVQADRLPYQYTTAGAVDAFARSLRLERPSGRATRRTSYERDVETFFRHSPAVVRDERR